MNAASFISFFVVARSFSSFASRALPAATRRAGSYFLMVMPSQYHTKLLSTVTHGLPNVMASPQMNDGPSFQAGRAEAAAKLSISARRQIFGHASITAVGLLADALCRALILLIIRHIVAGAARVGRSFAAAAQNAFAARGHKQSHWHISQYSR